MSDVSSLRSLLVVEERMRSNKCLQHWLVLGRHLAKFSVPVTPRAIMYFPSTPVPAHCPLLLSEKDILEWC